MKVLVVDDSIAARFILSKYLKEVGVQDVVQAAQGKEALEVLSSNADCELALVDWNMPVMNGYELVQEIRKEQRFQNLRIMMVTTETEMMQVVKAVEAGANEYIMKPFTKDVLADKLRILGLLAEESIQP